MSDLAEQVQYVEISSGCVYDLVFKGKKLNILSRLLDGAEITVHNDSLMCDKLFKVYTQQMKDAYKRLQDYNTLHTVSREIKLLLDDNHVICHASVNRDTKGLVEYTIMVGESV